jgi:glutathione-regulated potassium-efflux system ancillary protein KefF
MLTAGLPGPPGEGAPSAASTVVVLAHPQMRRSRITRTLAQAAAALPGVQVRDLYAMYPDYHVDVPAEQAALAAAQLVVLLHPVHWYSMPPLLKLWMDEVWAYQWAFGHKGTALRGKDLWLVASTGGAESAYHPNGYNRYFFDAFLPPYEQSAFLCGMRFLPPLLLHGARQVSAADLKAHAALLTQRLQTHPNWPEIEAVYPVVPSLGDEDRPALTLGHPEAAVLPSSQEPS